jgi:hypothetical protein
MALGTLIVWKRRRREKIYEVARYFFDCGVKIRLDKISLTKISPPLSGTNLTT